MKVIYSNCLPKGTGGMAIGTLIIIRPKYKDDQGLHDHERVHVEQFRADRWGFWRKYLLNHDYRLNAEVEGYRVQIEVTLKQWPEKRTWGALAWLFAGFIATRYRLRTTQEEAYQLLTEEP